MELIYSFKFSNTSLLFFSAIPFLYFGYHTAYWYRPDVLQRLDALYIICSILLAAVVGLIMIKGGHKGDWQFMQLGLLHLSPLVLSVLIASSTVQMAPIKARAALKKRKAKSGDVQSQGEYMPRPLNQEIEQISWDDLVISHSLREELISVITLLKDPKTAAQYGIRLPKGILLYGPPGTGKTTIAKVIAKTAGLSFFALKSDEVVSKWVGESEKNLSKLFKAANRYKPSIIFIDEIDSIGKVRSGNQVWADNLLNHLLQLVDGVVKQEGLYIVGATNRPDLVDAALKRSGRLENSIEVPLPDFEGRRKLFAVGLSKLKLDEMVNLDVLAQITEGKSGADIISICNQAGLNAFKRESAEGKREYAVTNADLERALTQFS